MRGFWQVAAHEVEPSDAQLSASELPAQVDGSLRVDPQTAQRQFRAILDELDAVIVADGKLTRAQRADAMGRLTLAYQALSNTSDTELLERAYSDMQLRVRQLELHDHAPTGRKALSRRSRYTPEELRQ